MLRTKTLLVLLVFVSLTVRVSYAASQECLDVPSESNFQPEQIEGTWYPIEIVQHRNDSKIYGVPLDTKCPVVTFSKNRRILTMVWNATEGELKYTFQQKGSGRLAQWQATGDQSGTGSSKLAILAVGTGDKYMILRYCSTVAHNTILLSRQNSRSQELVNEASGKLAELMKFPALDKRAMCDHNDASALKQLPLLLISAVYFLLRH